MNCFVTLIVVAAVFAGVQAGDLNDPKVKAVADKCAAVEKPSPADIEALKQHSSDLTREAKCMVACMMKEFGVLSAEGKPQRDVFMKHAQEECKGEADQMKHATEMFDICSSSSGSDICETAYLWGQCIMKEMVARNIPLVM